MHTQHFTRTNEISPKFSSPMGQLFLNKEAICPQTPMEDAQRVIDPFSSNLADVMSGPQLIVLPICINSHILHKESCVREL